MRPIRKVLRAAWERNNRPRIMTPAELIVLLRRMKACEATSGEWDYFQALALSDPRLEAIRERIAPLYRPGIDLATDTVLTTAIERAVQIAAADANGS